MNCRCGRELIEGDTGKEVKGLLYHPKTKELVSAIKVTMVCPECKRTNAVNDKCVCKGIALNNNYRYSTITKIKSELVTLWIIRLSIFD